MCAVVGVVYGVACVCVWCASCKHGTFQASTGKASSSTTLCVVPLRQILTEPEAHGSVQPGCLSRSRDPPFTHHTSSPPHPYHHAGITGMGSQAQIFMLVLGIQTQDPVPLTHCFDLSFSKPSWSTKNVLSLGQAPFSTGSSPWESSLSLSSPQAPHSVPGTLTQLSH